MRQIISHITCMIFIPGGNEYFVGKMAKVFGFFSLLHKVFNVALG